jgi:acyl CoA:acetate/3-ketoacid CoA transferase beta subunit
VAGGGVGAQGGYLAAHSVQGEQDLPGGGVSPDTLTQVSGFVIIEQTCLKIGQQLRRQRRVRVRSVAARVVARIVFSASHRP